MAENAPVCGVERRAERADHGAAGFRKEHALGRGGKLIAVRMGDALGDRAARCGTGVHMHADGGGDAGRGERCGETEGAGPR